MLTVLAMLALPAVARGFCFRKNLINKNLIEKFLFRFVSAFQIRRQFVSAIRVGPAIKLHASTGVGDRHTVGLLRVIPPWFAFSPEALMPSRWMVGDQWYAIAGGFLRVIRGLSLLSARSTQGSHSTIP